MLIQFNFRNYRCYQEQMSLDLSATKYTEHSGHIIIEGTEKLLPAAVIFGANSAGKTTILNALCRMKELVLNGVPASMDESFFFAEEKTPTMFEVYFTDSETEKSYCYGFELGEEGIEEEWLSAKSRTQKQYRELFYREKEDINISGLSAGAVNRIHKNLSRRSLLLHASLQEGYDKAEPVRKFFDGITVMHGSDSVCIEGKPDPAINAYLNAFDPSIEGLEEDGENRILVVRKDDQGNRRMLPLSHEAEGVRRMCALYPLLKKTMEEGGVLLCDNLDFGLHTLLVRNIMITFLTANANPNHAQIIMTTHDSWLLSNHVLRRDEIWFARRQENQSSVLYSLAEFADEDGNKIRKDQNHEKNYMMGKYGAVPELDYLHLSLLEKK